MSERLIALALQPGAAFIEAAQDAWNNGDAVFPIDPRLPDGEQRWVFEAIRPTHIQDEDGIRVLHDGIPPEEGDALVIGTSGTTGHPKGVVLTHEALAAASTITNEAIGVDPGSDRWLLCIPAAHMGGFGVIARALHNGTPIDCLDHFDADDVQAAADRGSTLIALVPTAFRRIDPTAFRKILLGGSAIPRDLPANTIATYGLTETCGGVVYGGRPLPGVEIRIVDEEIQIRAPTLLRTYRSGGDPKTDDGWFATGDLGTFDNGVLEVKGRRDEVIITGGENVWPHRVEQALEMHPEILDVAVVSRPDDEWGEVVTAVVVPADSAQPPRLADLRDCVKEVLPAYMAPQRLELVKRIPRTRLGKIKRRRL